MNESTSHSLLALPQEQKEKLFIVIREGAHLDAINLHVQEYGISSVTKSQVDSFFAEYARERWTGRLGRAADEADAIISQVRQTRGQIPEATLVALGQEAFSQIASGKATPEDLARYTSIFLRAQEYDRSERALDLQIKKFDLSRRNATEKALDAFAREFHENVHGWDKKIRHPERSLASQDEVEGPCSSLRGNVPWRVRQSFFKAGLSPSESPRCIGNFPERPRGPSTPRT
jgi:hypothetical protein